MDPGVGSLYAVADDEEKIRSRSVIFGRFMLLFGFLSMSDGVCIDVLTKSQKQTDSTHIRIEV